MRKDYFLAFMLDCILHEDCFTIGDNGLYTLDVKKLKKRLRNIDNIQAQLFSQRYDVPQEEVMESLKYIPCSPNRMNQKIEANILNLRHEPFMKQLRNGGV
jgi:hypothetical protein